MVKNANTRQQQLLRRKKIRRLLTALSVYKPERVYVFGSWARGEADSLSDLDVIVIKETSAPFLERLQKVGRSLPYDLGAVDLLVYTPGEFKALIKSGNAFAEIIAEEGCLIYGVQK
jgi:predicted nucleotidyltransferase